MSVTFKFFWLDGKVDKITITTHHGESQQEQVARALSALDYFEVED